MTDIVERLCDGEHCTVGCAKLRAEAAAEIERLRAALQDLHDAAMCGGYPRHALAQARRALEPKP
jgi:hypothetical protein